MLPKSRNRHVRRLRLESLENRRLLTGVPLGAEATDTAEFLLGRVAVTPVFFESTGVNSEQDWTSEEITEVLNKIETAMDWWSTALDGLNTVHSLEFVYDTQYAVNPVETAFEPIANSSNTSRDYINDFLIDQGWGDSNSHDEAVRLFNDQQRRDLDADWGVTIVVVDASDDLDGRFAPGGFRTAFAYPGGMYMVVPSTRPTAVFTHELGHLFWANDEYSGGGSYQQHRGYYDTQNLNAEDNPASGFVQEVSIMAGEASRSAAFDSFVSPASTLASVGWQDSDQDGIFDLADVPLNLEGTVTYDGDLSQFLFTGFAEAVPLPNRNSEGLQNDITLNRIGRVEYRLDGGSWLTALQPDLQQTDVQFAVPVGPAIDKIEIRVIDPVVGVTSPILSATKSVPGRESQSFQAYAFLDADGDGLPSETENPFSGLQVVANPVDSSSFPVTEVLDAAQMAVGVSLENRENVQFTTTAIHGSGDVSVQLDDEETPLFTWFRFTADRWSNEWTADDQMKVDLDLPTTFVEVDLRGADAGSIGRVEAYDENGLLVARATSKELAIGESVTLRVESTTATIREVRVFGHSDTSIQVSKFSVGPTLQGATDALGLVALQALPVEDYQLQWQTNSVIYEVSPAAIHDLSLTGSADPTFSVAVRRVDSPGYNADLPADVDGNGRVEPVDALRIINYLNKNQSGPLTVGVLLENAIDTNNDGLIAPIDALTVINVLNRMQRPTSGSAKEVTVPGAVPALPVQGTAAGESLSEERQDESESRILATDRILANLGQWSEEEPQRVAKATNLLKINDYQGSEAADVAKSKDAANPFFSEPFRSEGF